MKRRSFMQACLGSAAAILAPTGLSAPIVKKGFSIDALPLPEGCSWARHIEGMREIRAYDVSNDWFVWRWDAMIYGEQYNVCVKQYGHEAVQMTAEEFSALHRPTAKAMFLTMRACKGKIAWFAA